MSKEQKGEAAQQQVVGLPKFNEDLARNVLKVGIQHTQELIKLLKGQEQASILRVQVESVNFQAQAVINDLHALQMQTVILDLLLYVATGRTMIERREGGASPLLFVPGGDHGAR